MERRRTILATMMLCILLSAPALAQPRSTTDYDLQPKSSFSEGCLEPCMCPIWATQELRGSFQLHLAGMEGSFRVYHVLEVQWEMPFAGGTAAVTGTGSYRVDRDAHLQQLELDLVVAEDELTHYDSGLVAVETPFPKIDIAVAMNGFFCWDRVFEIAAAPTTTIETHDASWGTAKAMFR